MKVVLSNTIIIIILSIVLGITFYFSLNNVYAETGLMSNGTMTVEVDLVEFTPPVPVVGLEIPNQINLGNLTKKTMVSKEIEIYVNNTGNTNITITPYLLDSSEEIFRHLYFRFQKTSNGSTVKQERIGNWSLKIEKPDEGDGYRKDSFYMQLNLKDYDKEIKEDILGHRAEIIFYAMSQ